MEGGGLVNNLINNLPLELHLPGYNYCGPGTRLQERLLRGDRGVNELDEACKQHDISYANSSKLEDRHKADFKLMNMAKQRIKSKNSSRGEKLASWLVNKVMKAKLKVGAGKKQKNMFNKVISSIGSRLKKLKPKTEKAAIKHAYTLAKKLFSKTKTCLPRFIPIPKTGGILPLIPIFAGLSALGALAGGSASIAKAVNDYKSAQKNLQESERHNKTMEAIALGKGLYIKPYKKGSGIFLQKSKNL